MNPNDPLEPASHSAPVPPWQTDPIDTLSVPPEPVDPLSAEVLAKLELPPEQKTWVQSLLLLGVSLLVFAAAGLFNYTLPDLVILVGVLLFHESGHYAGMRIFDYQDVKMFFIPFFGAAVSGRSTSVAGYKEAIVILLGPLPGIVLGAVLGTVCLFYDDEMLRSTARMLLLINGFNLLPFLPLDGGRFLHLVLFSRQRHIEALFRFVTGALLALIGVGLQSWVLAIVGLLMLISTGATFRVSSLARRLRLPPQPGSEMNVAAPIPREQAVPLIACVRATFPKITQVKTLTSLVRQVWERMHVEPPGVLASVVLLALYGGSLLGTPVIAALLNIPITSVHDRSDEGGVTQVEEVRVWGRVQNWTELDSEGRYHGRHVEYSLSSNQVIVEGTYEHGLQHGTWTTYDDAGQVKQVQVYERGVPVKR